MAAEHTSTAPDVREGNLSGTKPFKINPQDYIGSSFAFGVLNNEHFATMQGANFRPGLYIDYPVQLIRVADANPENKRGFNYMVYDGHHRLRAAQSFQEYLAELRATGAPIPDEVRKSIGNYRMALQELGKPVSESEYDFDVYAKDITDELINKPQYAGQEHFTPAQAIKEVIQPTMHHKEIAASRIAAHVLTDWNRIVGDNLNDRYSALAALTYLGKEELRDKPHAFLEKHLQGDDVALFVGVNDADREVLTRGFLEMADIVRETRQPVEDIRWSAFQAITSLPDMPESHMDKHVQVHGFFSLPEVRKKVQKSASENATRDDNRDLLGAHMYRSAPQAARNRWENRAYTDAIQDPNLSFAETLEVVTMPESDQEHVDTSSISKRYETVKKNINVRHMRSAFTVLNKGTEPDDDTNLLLANLSRTDIFTDGQVQLLAKLALSASDAIASANDLFASLLLTDLTGQAKLTQRELTTLIGRMGLATSELQARTLSRDIRRKVAELRQTSTAAGDSGRHDERAGDEPDRRRDQGRPATADQESSDQVEFFASAEHDRGLIERSSRTDGHPDADVREYGPVEVFSNEPPEQEPVSDLARVEEFLLFLDRSDIAPDALLGLGRVRKKLEGMLGIDWSTMVLRPEVGRDRWFSDRFVSRKGTELRPQDRHVKYPIV